jgi:hypothetical protein
VFSQNGGFTTNSNFHEQGDAYEIQIAERVLSSVELKITSK